MSVPVHPLLQLAMDDLAAGRAGHFVVVDEDHLLGAFVAGQLLPAALLNRFRTDAFLVRPRFQGHHGDDFLALFFIRQANAGAVK